MSVKKNQPPSRFSESDFTSKPIEAYKKYYQEQYQKEWNGNVTDVNYLSDLVKSIKSIFNTKKRLLKEASLVNSLKDLKDIDNLLNILFGIFIDDQGNIKKGLMDSFEKNPFIIFELANNSICLYTKVKPGVIYRVINKVYGEEHY